MYTKSGKQLEDQIQFMLDKVLDDEDLKDDSNNHFIDEEEPSFLDEKLNMKNILQQNKLIDGLKIDKFRSTRHLEDLNYINSISTTLSCNSTSAITASAEYCKRNRTNSFNLNEFGYNYEDVTYSNDLGIENLIIDNNPLDNLDKEYEIHSIKYNNILKLNDRIDEESFNRLQTLFLNIMYSENGSRVLQQCLKKTEKKILKLIFDEIIGNLSKILANPNANEFYQKLYTYLDLTDKGRFISELKTDFIELSRNKYTSKSLYVFITQILNNEEKLSIVECVRDNLLEMCYVIYSNLGPNCTQNS
jgi:hypothetical protein